MREFILNMWNWLGEKANYNPVMAIAAVAAVLVYLVNLSINLNNRRAVPTTPPPGGEVHMSVEHFQTVLEKRAQEVEERLTQAHGEERLRLENELTEVNRQLFDIEAAYDDALGKIRELESAFAHRDDERVVEIRAAIAAGNFSRADMLLAEIEDQANTTIIRAAEAAHQRGIIAALQIRWNEAATHFDKAARLDPTYDHLNNAGEFAGRAAQYKTARRHFEKLLEFSRHEYGERSSQTAVALNSLAVLFRITGQYHEAESLLRQVLDIRRETFGEKHPDYVAGLNSLGNVLRNASRFDEAEPLYRRAVEIGRDIFGEKHPNYADLLNGLANLLHDIKRGAEAEPLYRQAMEIDRDVFGEKHPNYAIRLNNLANVLRNARRFDEAEPLYRQAMEIDRDVFGEKHPNYASELNNLAGLLQVTGRYSEAESSFRQALDIYRATLGDAHPTTKMAAGNYAHLLRINFPEKPALAELEAVFGEDVGRN